MGSSPAVFADRCLQAVRCPPVKHAALIMRSTLGFLAALAVVWTIGAYLSQFEPMLGYGIAIGVTVLGVGMFLLSKLLGRFFKPMELPRLCVSDAAIWVGQPEAPSPSSSRVVTSEVEQVRVDRYTHRMSDNTTVQTCLYVESDDNRIRFTSRLFDNVEMEWIRDYLVHRLAGSQNV